MVIGNTTQMTPEPYNTPPFPALYWFVANRAEKAQYLYHQGDIWRFTLFWTIIIYEAVHIAASGYAVAVQRHNWRFMWVVPLVYMTIAGVEAVLAGTVVGLLLVLKHLSFTGNMMIGGANGSPLGLGQCTTRGASRCLLGYRSCGA